MDNPANTPKNKAKKLRLIGKVMAKDEDNLCRRELWSGTPECNGEDLLTQCKNMSTALGIPDVTTGLSHKKTIKKAI